MRKFLFSILMLTTVICYGQIRVDTLNLADAYPIRVLISGDTLMMSVRQFEKVEWIIEGLMEDIDLQEMQVQKLKEAVKDGMKIEERYKEADKIRERQVEMYREGYNTAHEIAANQNQLLLDMSNRVLGQNRKTFWTGLGCGVAGGVVVGIITSVILLK